MKTNGARHVALMGMLFALAMVLSFIESSIAPLLGLPPGVKLGLSNVVVLYALLCLSARSAAALAVLKAGFALLTRGVTAGLLSLTGGLLALLVMWLLCRFGQEKQYFILSVCGALAHNLGQLAAVTLLTQSRYTLYYLPVLLVSGLVVGSLTALVLRAVMPALQRLWAKR